MRCLHLQGAGMGKNKVFTTVSGIFLSSVAFFSPAFAENETGIRVYADVFAITAVAEDRCPNVRVNDGLIRKFKKTMGVTDSDKLAVDEEVNSYLASLAKKIVQGGANAQAIWCDKAWDLLGPEGTMIKNALKPAKF